MTLAERIATVERGIRMAWQNRRYEQSVGRADEAADAARRIRGYINLLRELDAIAARQSQKIAEE